MGPYEFQILQDFGNGWVAARVTLGSSALMFVNLYQTPVLFPRDERGAASRPGLHTTFVQKLSLTYYTHNPLSIKASLAGEKS